MKTTVACLTALMLASCTSAPSVQAPSRASAVAPRFGDADPTEWAGIAPSQYPVHGIDVSRYQGEIDWDQVRASGAAFAFIKATEGGDHLDARFLDNWAGAARAGVPRGAYHYYYFCRSADEQAAWFIRHVPRHRFTLPPVLDIEWNHRSRNCPFRPAPAAVRAEMRVFLQRLTRHYGKRPIIYSTIDFYTENALSQMSDYPFWLRSVADHPSATYPAQNWTFWQYTGTGEVPGIAGLTDINVFAGSAEQWWQWMSQNAS